MFGFYYDRTHEAIGREREKRKIFRALKEELEYKKKTLKKYIQQKLEM